jgi:hypothetical protein
VERDAESGDDPAARAREDGNDQIRIGMITYV